MSQIIGPAPVVKEERKGKKRTKNVVIPGQGARPGDEPGIDVGM
jgi:hypothetical protein